MIKLLAICLLLFSLPIHAETYALIIGVNKYEKSHFPNLKGAVNDAKLIYQTLLDTGVPRKNLIKLTDEKATKKRIENEWQKLIGRSKAGDTLIFSFAGHGTQEKDQNGDEALLDPEDTLDETLLLSGYTESPRIATNERLVDDEMYTLFKRASGRRIIYVADSCHSGGTTRSIDPRASQYAWQPRYASMSDTKLSKPAIVDSSKRVKEEELENFYFFAATESRKMSLEGIIEESGVAHGALSWAFSKVLKQALSKGKSGLTFSEMKDYIHAEVRNLTSQRQFTAIRPRGGGTEVLFKLASNKKGKSKRKSGIQDKTVKLAIEGETPKWIKNIQGLQLTAQDPDIIWDVNKKEVLNKQGDITAYKIENRSDLAQVINRVRLVAVIDRLAKGHFTQSQLSAAGDKDKSKHAKLHQFGSKVVFHISNLNYTYLYQFNMAGNGEIQCYPAETVNQSKQYEFNATPPAGNDTLITLVLKKPSAQLAKLVTENSCDNAVVIAKQLPILLKKQAYQLGRVDVFTGK